MCDAMRCRASRRQRRPPAHLLHALHAVAVVFLFSARTRSKQVQPVHNARRCSHTTYDDAAHVLDAHVQPGQISRHSQRCTFRWFVVVVVLFAIHPPAITRSSEAPGSKEAHAIGCTCPFAPPKNINSITINHTLHSGRTLRKRLNHYYANAHQIRRLLSNARIHARTHTLRGVTLRVVRVTLPNDRVTRNQNSDDRTPVPSYADFQLRLSGRLGGGWFLVCCSALQDGCDIPRTHIQRLDRDAIKFQ